MTIPSAEHFGLKYYELYWPDEPDYAPWVSIQAQNKEQAEKKAWVKYHSMMVLGAKIRAKEGAK